MHYKNLVVTSFLLYIFILMACKKEIIATKKSIVLDSGWEFCQAGTNKWQPAIVPGCVHTDLLNNDKINDPFYRINEKKQQWIDMEDWVYRNRFKAYDQILNQSHIEINFKGLDTYADVYLNDSLIISAKNMFREWNADIKDIIKSDNELKIYFHSPVKEGLKKLNENEYPLPAVNDQSENGGIGNKLISPFTRKAPYHYGWDWGPRFVTSGIWRPVEIVVWNDAKFETIQIIQNEISSSEANITANYQIIADSSFSARININCNGKLISTINNIHLEKGVNNISGNFKILNPKLWWTNGLGKQHLYSIKSDLLVNEIKMDEKIEKIGLRSLKIVRKPDSLGTTFYVELNGRPVFMKGANYIPNDNFLDRVTPEKYEYIIKSAADVNMNMLRVWGGGIYENDIFYELCDKYGILVWQDFMFACSMYPGNDEFLKNVETEAIQNIQRLRNHPCIALWCGNNEIDGAWGQYKENHGWGWKQQYNPEQRNDIWKAYDTLFHKILPDLVNKYDITRFYWPSSPIADFGKHAYYESKEGDIHYWGVWHGKEPFEGFEKYVGRFMSEYGFQSFPSFNTVKKFSISEDWYIESEVMTAHQRSGIGNLLIKEYMGWYYQIPDDFQSFLYLTQVLQAEGIKMAIEAHRRNMPVCMGTLYWQLNDCWPVASWSSIDYYGQWKALQYFARDAYKEILVSAKITNEKLEVYIISDRFDETAAKLVLQLKDFSGNIIWSKSLPVNVKHNTSNKYFEIILDQFVKQNEKNKTFLQLSLYEGKNLISENICYFSKIKDIKLPVPVISKNILTKDNIIEIELRTDRLAKNLYLCIDEVDGVFSDNYFDLLPGESKKITFTGDLSVEELKNNLKIITLAEIYNN